MFALKLFVTPALEPYQLLSFLADPHAFLMNLEKSRFRDYLPIY
jgi:hypothetical protein